MSKELNPHSDLLEAEPIYRKNLAQGLLYKTILAIVNESLDDRLKSGSDKFARFKEVSKGQQSFKSDAELWPMNMSVPKVEGKAQCTGEAEYTDDIPPIYGELHAAVVQAKQANCELEIVDPSAALVSIPFYILTLLMWIWLMQIFPLLKKPASQGLGIV